jgi:pimeloyl-ACP methyl ester carboxylesterase
MWFERDGTCLAFEDLGGSGPPALLLHGLAGYAGEWKRSAELLAERYHVFALDQRGHGNSERRPADVSRDAYTDDAAGAIRQIGLGPVTLIGQSMGASTAMLTAARYSELASRLVVIEGSPDGPDAPDATRQAAKQIGDSLARWPVPFADQDAARRFFASKGFDPDAWTAGLEQRDGQLWPRFEVDTMVACIADVQSRSYWTQWRTIQCPTLAIFGERGMFDAEHQDRVAGALPGCELVRIPCAGHDVHLEAPQAWVQALFDLTVP